MGRRRVLLVWIGALAAGGNMVWTAASQAQPPFFCPPEVACRTPMVPWGHYPTRWRRWPGELDALAEAGEFPEISPEVPSPGEELQWYVAPRTEAEAQGAGPGSATTGAAWLPSLDGPVDLPPAPPADLPLPDLTEPIPSAARQPSRRSAGAMLVQERPLKLRRIHGARPISAAHDSDPLDPVRSAIDSGWKLAGGPKSPTLPPSYQSENPLRAEHGLPSGRAMAAGYQRPVAESGPAATSDASPTPRPLLRNPLRDGN